MGSLDEPASTVFTEEYLKKLVDHEGIEFYVEANSPQVFDLCKSLNFVDPTNGVLEHWFTLPKFVPEKVYQAAIVFKGENKPKFRSWTEAQIAEALHEQRKEGKYEKVYVIAPSVSFVDRYELQICHKGNFVYAKAVAPSKVVQEVEAKIIKSAVKAKPKKSAIMHKRKSVY
jgi:ADP-heptose:LPS heptosyltransferase